MRKEHPAADDNYMHDDALIWDDASLMRMTLYPYRIAHILDGSRILMSEINAKISEYL